MVEKTSEWSNIGTNERTSMIWYIDKDMTSPQCFLCQKIHNPSLNMRKLQSNPKWRAFHKTKQVLSCLLFFKKWQVKKTKAEKIFQLKGNKEDMTTQYNVWSWTVSWPGEKLAYNQLLGQHWDNWENLNLSLGLVLITTMVIRENAVLRKIPKYFGEKGHNVSDSLSSGWGNKECVWSAQTPRRRNSEWQNR